jgi:hypothetical protein
MTEKLKKRTTRVTEVVEEFDAHQEEPEKSPEQPSRVCGLEGCEKSLEGRRADARFCSEAHRQKQHDATPKRKAANAAAKLAQYHDDPVGYTAYQRWQTAKTTAKRDGIPFTITKEDVRQLIEQTIATGCSVTRQPVRLYAPGEASGKMQNDAFSLDKREPALGYVKDNVRGVCWKYNETKGAMTRQHIRREILLDCGPFIPVPYSSIPPTNPAAAALYALGQAVDRYHTRVLMISLTQGSTT